MLKKRFFKVSLLAVYLFVSLVFAAPAADESKIVILHVNDLHAQLDSLPKIAWYVAQEKKKHKDVFFVNVGDNFTGNPVSDLYEPKGLPMMELLNLIKLDAMAIGNHDFDHGQSIIKRFIEKANFPLLCANVKMPPNHTIPQPKPFCVLKTSSGLKIALLGLIEIGDAGNKPSTLAANVKGLTFSDPLETAKKYSHLKQKDQLFILLSHVGVEEDVKMAEEIPQLDAIIGGHSHTLLHEPRMVNNVLIAQAGGNGRYIGRVELVVKDGKIIKKSGEVIQVSKIENEIADLKERVDTFNSNPVLKRVVTTLSRSVRGKDELGHLITDGLRKRHHLDIAFHAEGGIRTPRLERNVTVKDIYSLHPFSNVVVIFNMTPDEIRSLIAYDYSKRKRRSLKVSGIRYDIYRSGKFEISKIVLKTPDGKLLDESKTYSVGMNNYIATAFKFEHKDPGKTVMVTLAENMIKYLEESNGKEDVCAHLGEFKTFEFLQPDDSLKKIGEFKGSINTGSSFYDGSTSAGNLMADAIRWKTGVDIATFPSNGLRYGVSLPPDNHTFYSEYIAGMYFYSNKNKALTAKIKGKDFKEFLLERCRRESNADLQVSGMTYTLFLDAHHEVSRLECKLANGDDIEDNVVYTVAFNDFMFHKYYKLKDIVSDVETGTSPLSQVLEMYVKHTGTIPSTISEKRITMNMSR